MGNIKAKTHLEKLGFSETDKKSPKHDAIQTWVYENIKQIVSETVMKNSSEPYEIVHTKWEHQIVHQSGYVRMIVGYIDIMVHLKGVFYDKNSDCSEPHKQIFIEVKRKFRV